MASLWKLSVVPPSPGILSPALPWQIFTDQELGKGMFGKVFKGLLDGTPVAIKRIDKTEFLSRTPEEQKREEDALRRLRHPNVLRLFQVEVDAHFKYFILELCEATVTEYCKGTYTGPMPNPEALALYQMANGLAHIHLMGLVHRDIKSDNVLIYKTSETSAILKISDFGMSKPITASGNFSVKSGVKGTRYYYSPELLHLCDEEEESLLFQKANISSDVFALGILFFWYLTKGKHPFSCGKSSYHIPVNVMEGCYDLQALETGHRFARDIIEGMIRAHPDNRFNLQQVIEILKPYVQSAGEAL